MDIPGGTSVEGEQSYTPADAVRILNESAEALRVMKAVAPSVIELAKRDPRMKLALDHLREECSALNAALNAEEGNDEDVAYRFMSDGFDFL